MIRLPLTPLNSIDISRTIQSLKHHEVHNFIDACPVPAKIPLLFICSSTNSAQQFFCDIFADFFGYSAVDGAGSKVLNLWQLKA
jgi:hypothetical protein